ncbi:MAG: hypothetical protein K8S55_04525 [Phycisphaerae bacterium]|nr:hypothetical protein [Phycisphaerae bacterium]
MNGNTTMRWAMLGLVVVVGLAASGCEEINHGGSSLGGNPKGNYSILLYLHKNPDLHIKNADDHLKQAKEATNWDDLFVIHEENHSGLYWGHFSTKANAQRRVDRARAFKTKVGAAVFGKAMAIRLPDKDPKGPEEWKLANAPKNAYYTVVVAVFFDIPSQDYFGRKRRAVELCGKLRQQGKEAYYYHSPAKSGVTLGAFPKSAMETRKVQIRHPQSKSPSFIDKKIILSQEMDRLLQEYSPLLVCGNTDATKEYDFQKKKFVSKMRKAYATEIPGRKEKSAKPRKTRPASPQRPVGKPIRQHRSWR